VQVQDKRSAKMFLQLPAMIYRNDPEWIGIPDDDLEAVFDPGKNNFFSHGDCIRWILFDNKNQLAGRIAAFINFNKSNSALVPTGGIGFFECINDKQAAHHLFDTAKEWLQSRGMKAMEGPVNFGENDNFWGLLIEGFTAPSYGMNYNPSYYIDLFESYGFRKAYDQVTNVLDPSRPLPERFTQISNWVMKKEGYSFKHFSSQARETFFNDFLEVYNDAWRDFENFTPIDLPGIRGSFRQMKPIMDEKIIWFAYYEKQPIAFIICLPDANQLLKHLHGKMNFFNKLKFLWYRHTRTIDRIRITVMGCKQRFQNKGIESALIRCMQNEVLPRNTIREVELAWVGDFNKKMLALHEATGAVPLKLHRTYRIVFD
jgi:hypothetical protein